MEKKRKNSYLFFLEPQITQITQILVWLLFAFADRNI